MVWKVASQSVWAPPSGSFSTPWTMPPRRRSWAVSFITAQASPLREASFHRMEAKPSGDRTEYTACSSMSTRLATARAKAPPLPPSPVMTEMTGTVRELIRARHWAMASPWPRSSASLPG